MTCPRCQSPMTPNSRLTPDERQLATTHLCPSCFKRALTFAPNPRYVPPAQRDDHRPRPGDKRTRMANLHAVREATTTAAAHERRIVEVAIGNAVAAVDVPIAFAAISSAAL